MNKKAAAFILVGFAFFLASLSLIFSPALQPADTFQKYIGEHQYSILTQSTQAEEIEFFYELAFEKSVQDAFTPFFAQSGYYLEVSEDNSAIPYPCGTHIFPVFSLLQSSCYPRFIANYEAHVEFILNQYQEAFAQKNLISGFETVSSISGNNLLLQSTPSRPLTLQFSDEGSQVVQSSPYKINEEIVCSTGECFAQVAENFYAEYAADGFTFPYVWGGESPYTYEETKKLQENPDSIFNGVSVTRTEPGRSALTQAGFDCSGWTWWVGRHAGVPDFQVRQTADSYMKRAQSNNAQLICGGSDPCYANVILDRARPGDILYYGTSTRATHIMIYVGEGIIIHSRGSKGLIREPIPLSYASDSNTKIIATYRHQYDTSGVEEINPVETGEQLVGPAVWCTGTEQGISSRSQERITRPATGYAGTLNDIAVAAGLEAGVDPALIATHMQWESSIGEEDKCQPEKSSLTGCGWYPSCSAQCGCNNTFVQNDYTQVQCTAQTDYVAFQEAITGQSNLATGQYEACNAYIDNETRMWNCILCIYQGNYARDVTEKNNPYFLDGGYTCNYAEEFKTSYCSWRQHFSDQGYKLDARFSARALATANTLSFKPELQEQVRFPAQELQEFNTYMEELTNSCNDAITSCVPAYTEAWSTATPRKINVSVANIEHGLAFDIVNQVADCMNNDQESCYCQIRINPTLSTAGLDELRVRFLEDGSVFVDEWDLIFGTAKVQQLAQFSHGMSLSVDENHEYVEFLLDIEEKEYKFDLEELGFDENWKLNSTLPHIHLRKHQGKYIWINPEEEIEPVQLCRELPRHFPLTVNLTEEYAMNFSVELQDTVGPVLFSEELSLQSCLGVPTLELTWQVPNTGEKVYGFTLQTDTEDLKYFYLDAEAQNLSNPKTGALYKKQVPGAFEYTTYFSQTPLMNAVNISRNYTLRAYDHYLNTQEINITFQQDLLLPTALPELSLCTQGTYKTLAKDALPSAEALEVIIPEVITSSADQVPVLTGSISGLSEENTLRYLQTLGRRESGNNYSAVNTIGYLGKYQFGAAALYDLGYVNRNAYDLLRRTGQVSQRVFLLDENNWNDPWSQEAFLNSPEAQESAILEYTNRNYRTLLRNNALQSDSSQAEVAGFLMAAHLGGAGRAIELAKDPNFTFQDGYGTSISEYYDLGFNAVENWS